MNARPSNSRWWLACMFLVATALVHAAPEPAPGHVVEQLVPGSAFKGVHGLGVDARDRLVAGSVVGESVYDVDVTTGRVTTRIGPPQGEADDMVFLPDGTLVYTSIRHNVVRAQLPGGEVKVLAPDLVSVNSIAYDRKRRRLYVAQVFGGDAVWELDPQGTRAPRRIIADVGGFNGFDIGPDGMLYGPLWFKGQVARIDPDSGELQVVADGFATPAAANFDSKHNLFVLDTARGEVVQVDIRSGAKKQIAKLRTSLDNLAFDSQDRMYVSNMADNSIQRVDVRTGAAEEIVRGGLSVPLGLAVYSAEGRDTLHLADVFAWRSIDGRTGAVTDVQRMWAAQATIQYPAAVSVSDRFVVLTAESGVVQQYDRMSHKLLQTWRDLAGLCNAFALESGELLVVDARRGAVLRINATGRERREIVGGLGAISGCAFDGRDLLYVTDAQKGQLVQINLKSAARNVVATDLSDPRAIARLGDSSIVVVELTPRRLIEVDVRSGERRVVATNLPIGFLGTGAEALPIGLAAGADGTIYVTSDRENSIYRIRRTEP